MLLGSQMTLCLEKVGIVFVVLLIAGCAEKESIILTGASTVSAQDAAVIAQQRLEEAELVGCKAIGIGAGTGEGLGVGLGIGIVIPDDCAECEDLKDNQRETLREERTSHSVYVLVQCPIGTTLGPVDQQ